MLFNEIYGSYYHTVTSILAQAVDGNLTDRRIEEIVMEKAFGESVLSIPSALKSQTWPFLTKDNKTHLRNRPYTPLSTLQKRWLKSLLQDPRIKLFSPSQDGLENVEPLYNQDVFCQYDRYSDGDKFDNPSYIKNFQTILSAIREKRKINVTFYGKSGTLQVWSCIPYKLEYSSKDDKFRVTVSAKQAVATVNLARITSCKLSKKWTDSEGLFCEAEKETVVLTLKDERNALERVMLHFSDLEKETERINDNSYKITLRYNMDDEAELLIRILSFGPFIKVVSPNAFVRKIKERLNNQNKLRA